MKLLKNMELETKVFLGVAVALAIAGFITILMGVIGVGTISFMMTVIILIIAAVNLTAIIMMVVVASAISNMLNNTVKKLSIVALKYNGDFVDGQPTR